MNKTYKRLKYACYTTNLSMSVVAYLSPVLFITFRSLYGISYSLLGLLVLVNFVVQLTVDLIFSFFSHKFNISKTVKITPLLTVMGLSVYAILPWVLPDNAYLGLILGTVIFSASGGLAEVLISPVIAELPSEDPDREMSKLHSVYAWGVVFVILFSTLFLLAFGSENWQYLSLVLMIIPVTSCVLFSKSKIPNMKTPEKVSDVGKQLKNKNIWICVLAIFFGGAAECTMAQWSSGYLEQALNIPKVWGDIFGVALFGVMLGLGRTIYSKYGKNITKVLMVGIIGAAVCYIVSAVSNIAVVCLFACALTGLCVSMLWPGCLIVASDKFPNAGVFLFALMASGGDLGASVGPQLVGIVADVSIKFPTVVALAERLNLSLEQIGMKIGMCVGALFPIVAIPLFIFIYKHFSKNEN